MIRRLNLRGTIIAVVASVALAAALSTSVLLTISARRHAAFDALVARTWEDAAVAAAIRREIEHQLELASAHAQSPGPLYRRQFDAAGAIVHDQLRFYLFRSLNAAERRLVERIKTMHARLEVHAQRVFMGAPYLPEPELVEALGRDLDAFVAARQQERARVAEMRTELNRVLLSTAIIMGVLFLVGVLLLWRLLRRRLLDRLDALTRAAALVGAGDLATRVPLQYDDELTVVGAAFNRMVEDRELATSQLRASEERFRSLIENGSEAIVVLDRDGIVRYQSPAIERMLGYARDGLLGAQALELAHPDEAPRLGAELEHALRDEAQSGYLEFRCRHRNGEWRILRAVASNLLRDPHVQGIVLNMVDVTEQRRLEMLLMHSQKMEAVGRLAGGIAHDFNNLLTAMGGYTELLQQRAGSEVPPELAEIQHAVRRAGSLTRQLLTFSRQQVVRPRPLELGMIAEQLRTMLVRLIGEDIELVCNLAPAVWVLADPGQLEQVLLNLVVNARDAMPAGGTLTIEVRAITLADGEHGLRAGRYAELAVADTGHGMSPEVLTQIFEPFFTTKEVGKGTGLGLPTVYGIATQAGGTVTAESVPGMGSRFRVLLPLITRPAAAPSPVPPVDAPPRGRERVLLVEDEPAVRLLAERVLRRQGHDVASAANGLEALALLEHADRPFELVLTDIIMPEMGGPELVQRILERQPDIRVLFMSGYARERFVDTGVLPGPMNFLAKPFTPAQLTLRVREVLDEGRVMAGE